MLSRIVKMKMKMSSAVAIYKPFCCTRGFYRPIRGYGDLYEPHGDSYGPIRGFCRPSGNLFNITGTLKDGVTVGAFAEVKHSFPQEVSHLTGIPSSFSHSTHRIN